jgi:NAD-dependent SIR2 family protein deacetylase
VYDTLERHKNMEHCPDCGVEMKVVKTDVANYGPVHIETEILYCDGCEEEWMKDYNSFSQTATLCHRED